MFDSPVLILDEPTTGLDPASLITLKEMIATGKTILITSHIMQFVEEISDVIIYLLEGKIYFKWTIQELKVKTGEENFEKSTATSSMKKAENDGQNTKVQLL